jgi:hypothetical protein
MEDHPQHVLRLLRRPRHHQLTARPYTERLTRPSPAVPQGEAEDEQSLVGPVVPRYCRPSLVLITGRWVNASLALTCNSAALLVTSCCADWVAGVAASAATARGDGGEACAAEVVPAAAISTATPGAGHEEQHRRRQRTTTRPLLVRRHQCDAVGGPSTIVTHTDNRSSRVDRQADRASDPYQSRRRGQFRVFRPCAISH